MRYRRTTDRQTTDGRAIAYSEREREFTFSKNTRVQRLDYTLSGVWTKLVTDVHNVLLKQTSTNKSSAVAEMGHRLATIDMG